MVTDIPKKFAPQKVKRFCDALLVHLVDFPIYYVECISERHFIIAGGGGSSRTGVHNQINILELVPSGESCTADMIMKYTAPEEIPDAIMNGSLMRHLPILDTRFVTGGTHATVYRINFDPLAKSFAIKDYEILRHKEVKAELKSVKSIPGKILTGSIDGHLTIWDESTDKQIDATIKAHTKEIDDIDVDLLNQRIVTLSRDEGKCIVWNLKDLKTIREFKKENISTSNSKFSYRSCNYAYDRSLSANSSKSPDSSFLLIACNPIPNKGPSKILRLDARSLEDATTLPIKASGIMAMSVSLDGKSLAIGTRSGSVSIYDVKSFKQTYKLDGAHQNAVTNLDFLEPIPETLSLTNSETCALLSVSIDRRVVLHRPRKSSFTFSLLRMILMVLVIYLIFFYLYKNYTS